MEWGYFCFDLVVSVFDCEAFKKTSFSKRTFRPPVHTYPDIFESAT